MSAPALVIAISFGAAVLALWVFVRYPRFMPSRAGLKMAHLVVALAIAQYGAPTAMSFVLHGGEAVGPALFALFFIFLPSQLYAYLSGIWVLGLLRNALQAR